MPLIRNPKQFTLPDGTVQVLEQLFAAYQEVILSGKFSSVGYSGSWVYLLHLLKNGRPELPVVAKIGAPSLIQKEANAYQQCVQNQWPGIAELRFPQAFLPDNRLAGLYYPLMGGGVFNLRSLHHFLLTAEIATIKTVLTGRLFTMMKERILYPAHIQFEASLHIYYDSILPVNLLLELATTPSGMAPVLITPADLLTHQLLPGAYVRLTNFVITKVDLRRQTVTLSAPGGGGTVRLKGITDLIDFQTGQLLPSFTGRVLETRLSRLAAEATRLLGPTFNPIQAEITLSNGAILPNPLLVIPQILTQPRHLKINCIHGDLNLENILVDPQVGDIRLIDFAEARRDHVLHDFLRLETEVVTKLMPGFFQAAGLDAAHLERFYHHLHCATFGTTLKPPPTQLARPFAILTAVRRAARAGLYNPEDYTEYYEGLLLYLLGALKFRGLDEISQAKYLAFLAAAVVCQMLQTVPSCHETADQGVALSLADEHSPTTLSTQPSLSPDSVTIDGRSVTHHTTTFGDEALSGFNIQVGQIHNSHLAIGPQAQIIVNAPPTGVDFASVYRQINQRPPDPKIDKTELLDLTQKIQTELAKGHQANKHKVERWLNSLNQVAPDVLPPLLAHLSSVMLSDEIKQLINRLKDVHQ